MQSEVVLPTRPPEVGSQNPFPQKDGQSRPGSSCNARAPKAEAAKETALPPSSSLSSSPAGDGQALGLSPIGGKPKTQGPTARTSRSARGTTEAEATRSEQADASLSLGSRRLVSSSCIINPTPRPNDTHVRAEGRQAAGSSQAGSSRSRASTLSDSSSRQRSRSGNSSSRRPGLSPTRPEG